MSSVDVSVGAGATELVDSIVELVISLELSVVLLLELEIGVEVLELGAG